VLYRVATATIRAAATILIVALIGGLDNRPDASPTPSAHSAAPTTQVTKPVKIASLVPAASDLIVGMGAADRLVAVSNFDVADDRTRHLPRVGDYQTVDWEKLATLRPDAMVVQFDPDRIPPGLRQRAEALGIAIVNTRNNRLADVFNTLDQLGNALGLPDQAAGASARLRAQLDAVSLRTTGRPRVRALIVTDDVGRHVVGPNTYLDDLLALAGGENVMAAGDKPYLQIDRERLRTLNPAVIIQLLPNATEQEREQSRRAMAALAGVAAVRDGRVHVIAEPWVLLPGYHVGDLAEKFAAALHPAAATTTPDGGTAR
jgi:iron complex transport system substrate-binding protein